MNLIKRILHSLSLSWSVYHKIRHESHCALDLHTQFPRYFKRDRSSQNKTTRRSLNCSYSSKVLVSDFHFTATIFTFWLHRHALIKTNGAISFSIGSWLNAFPISDSISSCCRWNDAIMHIHLSIIKYPLTHKLHFLIWVKFPHMVRRNAFDFKHVVSRLLLPHYR